MGVLEEAIRENSHALGFSLVGIAPASDADSFALYQSWVNAGFAGEMRFMVDHPERRQHPRSILPTVRSVIMVGMEYAQFQSDRNASPSMSAQPKHDRTGCAGIPTQPETESNIPVKISRYAVGRDYHQILKERLNRLLAWLKSEVPNCDGRAVVDTAPLLERDFARRAGLGWIGKNAMLINKRLGSYLFLGALLTTLELTPDSPQVATHCGTCTACLTACPTSALVEPGRLDARRCISYLTIELRGPIPQDLRADLDGWLFGCDVCQEVCPWNRHATADVEWFDALQIVQLDEETFQRQFRGTALQRTKRQGLVRNAAVILGERGDLRALEPLRKCCQDSDPVIREAARWAIQQIVERSNRLSPTPTSAHSALSSKPESSSERCLEAADSSRKCDQNL